MENGHSPSDADLVRLARTGDQQAAARLYHRYADAVHRIAYRVLLEPAAAKDCCQEVWIKVFRKLDTFNSSSNFSGWINTIAVRTAIDEYRKRGRSNHIEMEESALDAFTHESASARKNLAEHETQKQIEAALSCLSVAQRAAFVLRHYEGESIEFIAQQLDCHPGTVKTHIHRAVKVLRSKLAPLKEVVYHAE